MSVSDPLRAALRKYWGYDEFRPLQEDIVRALLDGTDAAVVMPTGGGKSLCYQLPALVSGQTAIVISPLISLMQDQVQQLEQMGIPAAVLNSSMPADEQAVVRRNAINGKYRLLYLSPERIARPETLGWMQRVPIGFFAIDEAHCISEWGHEFRPEYRQLRVLRENFPDRPIAAFTASATRRVRQDILDQLQLREPRKFIRSFHRPNLNYLVHEADAKSQGTLLVRALKHYAGANVIVYAPTIARVEETVDQLAERGIRAIPYHGQMEGETRKRNQERWMSDEVRVLVGTVAFGLGINKTSVRAVIHVSLPKSIEQYYQEAGRAGRDGEPADCLLLWRKKDVGLLTYFVEQLTDPREREAAWQRYHAVRRFVEASRCRHLQICNHFGETPKWTTCDACDICAALPEWLTREAAPEKAKARKKAAAAPEKTAPVPPPAPKPQARPAAAPAVAPDSLLEYLREWRREVARRRNAPAFMVLTDASLEDLARRKPSNLRELLQVTGIGEKKAETYGSQIFEALDRFARGARASEQAAATESPAQQTKRLLAEGKTFEEIAQLRSRQLSTVVGMVADLVERGELDFEDSWVPPAVQREIQEATARLGIQWLKPLRDALPQEITAEQIRLVVAKLRRGASG